MFEKFAVVKNAGLVKMPTTKSTAIAGSERELAQRAEQDAPSRDALGHLRPLFDRCVGHAADLQSLGRGDQLVPVPRRLAELLHDRAAPHDEHARADPQLVEVVGDEQHRRALLARTRR